MTHEQIGPPAESPCGSCPYRTDVPSGVWDVSEYAKLPRYDRETMAQPTSVFECHLTDRKKRRRICAGWAGCHDGHELLALRIAVVNGLVSPDTARITRDYCSPVPLFASGAEAALHGVRECDEPGFDALRTMEKIERVRSDISGSALT